VPQSAVITFHKLKSFFFKSTFLATDRLIPLLIFEEDFDLTNGSGVECLQDVELKIEREDMDDDFERPPTPFTPTPLDDSFSPEAVSPKREVITPEPIPPKSRPKTTGLSAKSSSETTPRRREVERLTGDSPSSKDLTNLPRRRTRRSAQEVLSPTILEKMRSYGIKEASVVMTKVDIPEDSSSAVVATVPVPVPMPVSKEKPKVRTGPKRLYRCLYCNETGSDAYKLLLHQMKMHPGEIPLLLLTFGWTFSVVHSTTGGVFYLFVLRLFKSRAQRSISFSSCWQLLPL